MLKLKKYEVLQRAEGVGIDSVSELANSLNISQPWMSSILNGSATPSVEVLVKLCKVLNCRIDDIAEYPVEATE